MNGRKNLANLVRKFLRGKQNDEEVAEVIEEAYEKIVLWKNNYRNQSIDFQSESMEWFLYDNGLRHERVKDIYAIPSLLLQKPNKILMLKDHTKLLQQGLY